MYSHFGTWERDDCLTPFILIHATAILLSLRQQTWRSITADNTAYKDSIPTVTNLLNEYDQSITVNK